MPTALDSADRKLLAVAGAFLVLLLVAIAFEAPTSEDQGETIPSTYSSEPGGAAAAYLLLQQLQYKVDRWERSPLELPPDSAGAMLILADPTDAPSSDEQRALESFVEEGGQVLFTGSAIESFFKAARVTEFSPESQSSQPYSANLPSPFTRGAPSVALQAEAAWSGADVGPPQMALYGDADSPVIVSWRLGEGRILWWAGPTPLTNAGISQSANMNLFLDAMNVPAAGSADAAPTQVYWDEYFHGERTSLWSYMQDTPVSWGLLQLGVLGVAVLFTFSRRSGPMAVPAHVSRLSPLEFVDTLGGLYERATAEPAMVGVVYQQFRGLLTRQLRLPSNTDDATLAVAIQTRMAKKVTGLSDTLSRASAASRAEKISAADALALIRGLEHYEEELGLKKPSPEEKS